MLKVFFLKDPKSGLYVHPGGKHIFDNSAYQFKEGKIGAIIVTEQQAKQFRKWFEKQVKIVVVSEELKPEN